MKRVALGLAALVVAALFFSCPDPGLIPVPSPGPSPEDPTPEPPPPENPVAGVFVAGYYVTQDNRRIPCYWDQNGNKVDLNLDGANQGEAVVITTFGGNLYIAGFYYDDNRSKKPCRWDKDGNKTNINIAGTVQFFTFYGSDIYMAGADTERAPCYWDQNGNKTLLSGCVEAKGIAVRDSGNIFVAGYTINTQYQQRAHIWTNGQQGAQLDSAGTPNNMNVFATGIAVSGSRVYVCGYGDRFWNYVPWYWGVGGMVIGPTNETVILPLNGGGTGTTNGVVFADDHLYVLGTVDNIACYWDNGVRKTMEAGSTISSLAASGGSVYIAGSSSGPCYWNANGAKIALTTEGKGGGTYSIVIAN